MEEKTQDDIEWENRVLCSDGNCIGVIGPDGRCKECGRRYEGDLPVDVPGNGMVANAPGSEQARPPDTETAAEYQEEKTASFSDEEWENRRLCVDGNCIGVIGPDGKCKECGRPYEP